ncbi:MAG: universal stress protein [Chitinophagales bacterium]
MKNILVPIDFTEATHNLLDYAFHLAEKMDCEIRLFHAVDDPFVKEKMPYPPPVMDEGHTEELIFKMQIDANENMNSIVDDFNNKLKSSGYSNVRVTGNIGIGIVEDKILEEAASFQPQIILIGTHGHKKLGRIFFGTVTQAIIRRSHFPVLAIPYDFVYRQIKEVVYMSDLHNDDSGSIARLINLFTPFEIKLHITHFNTDDISGEEKLFELSEQFRNDHREMKIDYEIIDGAILREAYKEYIKEKNIDIIALTTRKLSGFQRFFNPGVAVDVLFHGGLPLLVFHKH